MDILKIYFFLNDFLSLVNYFYIFIFGVINVNKVKMYHGLPTLTYSTQQHQISKMKINCLIRKSDVQE